MQEFVVIGAGLAGAATAWQLAVRGHTVTVLERSTPGNPQGSSHGSARIFRYAYPQALYTGLVVRARRGWDTLEQAAGVQLIAPTGSLDHGEMRPLGRMAANLTSNGIDHELLRSGEAEARWPGLRFDTDVLWHPGAGVLDAIGSVDAMLGLASATESTEIRTDWPVVRLESIPGGYRAIGTAGRSIDAANVIVTAGGWLPALLSDLSLPSAFVNTFPALQVRQEQAAHFPYRSPVDPSRWPTFIYKGSDIQAYGLPGGRDAQFRGQKVAEYNGGRVLRSALDQDGIADPTARDRLIRHVTQSLPGLDPEPYAETTCLFTNTPSEDFLFDRVDKITIVSPCSGHGGKFAPLIGELAAELALGGQLVPDEFRLAAHSAKQVA